MNTHDAIIAFCHTMNAVGCQLTEQGSPKMTDLDIKVEVLTDNGLKVVSHVCLDLTKDILPQLETKAKVVHD